MKSENIHSEGSSKNLTMNDIESLLRRNQITKEQYENIITKISESILNQKNEHQKTYYGEIKRLIFAKYCMTASAKITQNFMKNHLNSNYLKHQSNLKDQLKFNKIDIEVKTTYENLRKIKNNQYKLNEEKSKSKTLLHSAEKKKRKRVIPSKIPTVVQQAKNWEQLMVRQKLSILKGFVNEQQMIEIQNQIFGKLKSIDKSSSYSDKMKIYLINHQILQRILSLMYKNTNNISIKHKNEQMYAKIKQQMIDIVTHQEETNRVLQSLAPQKHKPNQFPKINHQKHNQNKKQFFIIEKQKYDLVDQIEETFENAKKTLKEAFIKRNRPDYAYELELEMDNRKTPLEATRIR